MNCENKTRTKEIKYIKSTSENWKSREICAKRSSKRLQHKEDRALYVKKYNACNYCWKDLPKTMADTLLLRQSALNLTQQSWATQKFSPEQLTKLNVSLLGVTPAPQSKPPPSCEIHFWKMFPYYVLIMLSRYISARVVKSPHLPPPTLLLFIFYNKTYNLTHIPVELSS